MFGQILAVGNDLGSFMGNVDTWPYVYDQFLIRSLPNSGLIIQIPSGRLVGVHGQPLPKEIVSDIANEELEDIHNKP